MSQTLRLGLGVFCLFPNLRVPTFLQMAVSNASTFRMCAFIKGYGTAIAEIWCRGGGGGPTSCLIKNFQTYFFWLFYHLNKFFLIFWAISEDQTTYFCPNYMDRAELTSIETSADPDKRRKIFSKRLTSCWTVKLLKSSKKLNQYVHQWFNFIL